jgi:hypothetical protein
MSIKLLKFMILDKKISQGIWTKKSQLTFDKEHAFIKKL